MVTFLIFQLLPIITPLLLDQMTCSFPKNVTTFHEEKDGIIHFCFSPYKMGAFGTFNLHFYKKMDFSKLDFSTSSCAQFSWSGKRRWTRKNGASRFLILHTINTENQINIVSQNENILKYSSLSSCKDLDNMKNANLA